MLVSYFFHKANHFISSNSSIIILVKSLGNHCGLLNTNSKWVFVIMEIFIYKILNFFIIESFWIIFVEQRENFLYIFLDLLIWKHMSLSWLRKIRIMFLSDFFHNSYQFRFSDFPIFILIVFWWNLAGLLRSHSNWIATILEVFVDETADFIMGQKAWFVFVMKREYSINELSNFFIT